MSTPEQRRQYIDKIRSLPAQLRELTTPLTDTQLTTHYLPQEWSVAQNIHHLVDSHTNSVIRLKLMLTENHPPIKTYDQDAWAVLPDAKTAYIENSLMILEGLHDRWVRVWESLDEAQFQRTAAHPEHGTITIDDLLLMYADHCDAHLEQITRTLAAQP